MAEFEIKDRVAIVTGGVSGLGLQFALSLLAKGARGVTLADVNSDLGLEVIQEIEKKFGQNRAIFVKTDVRNNDEFEDAFKATVAKFKNIDFLLNNAGVFADNEWEKEIEINMKGTLRGILLALNYIPKYKSGPEGLILNVSSVTGICPYASLPVYASTKFAVVGMSLTFGLPANYNRTKVRIVGICPGLTITPMVSKLNRINTLEPAYHSLLEQAISMLPIQKPEEVAVHVMQVIEKAETGTIWVVEGNQPPYKYELPDRFKIDKVYL